MADTKPLHPDYEFKHISVHVIHILARMMAKKLVQEQLRDQGLRVTLVPPRVINERATTYLAQHPEVWREAITMAHRIDEKEGQRKARQKLRREELRQRRSVT
jgi:protein involved in temperature-dependent protein secretion